MQVALRRRSKVQVAPRHAWEISYRWKTDTISGRGKWAICINCGARGWEFDFAKNPPPKCGKR